MTMDKRPYVTGHIKTDVGEVPVVSTRWTRSDWIGAIKVRCAFGRSDYRVEPGLYAVGNPTPDSHVLVSANYKLSFDTLRKELDGLDAWIMVIDTKGINVWCAAGKGTFGTEEIIRRIDETMLKDVVTHRAIIVPQLGAPGVAAHDVKKRSGFLVIYGPVRAGDLRQFIKKGMKADPDMRRVNFSLKDRVILIPADMVLAGRHILLVSLAFFILGGGLKAVVNICLAYLAGAALVPALLPWLPGRSFSGKGLFAGMAVFGALFLSGFIGGEALEVLSWMFIFGTISSFVAMNFTGASTYTSFSGVVKEMGMALPLQIFSAVVGVGLWLFNKHV